MPLICPNCGLEARNAVADSECGGCGWWLEAEELRRQPWLRDTYFPQTLWATPVALLPFVCTGLLGFGATVVALRIEDEWTQTPSAGFGPSWLVRLGIFWFIVFMLTVAGSAIPGLVAPFFIARHQRRLAWHLWLRSVWWLHISVWSLPPAGFLVWALLRQLIRRDGITGEPLFYWHLWMFSIIMPILAYAAAATWGVIRWNRAWNRVASDIYWRSRTHRPIWVAVALTSVANLPIAYLVGQFVWIAAITAAVQYQ